MAKAAAAAPAATAAQGVGHKRKPTVVDMTSSPVPNRKAKGVAKAR